MSSPAVVHIEKGSNISSGKTSYKVEKELGEGGFGSVYLIRGREKSYAMKLTKMWTFMPHERLEYAKRFRQEYDYGSNINSPYLVKSHDFDLLKGNPFLVMDLCGGGNLRDWIGKKISPGRLDKLAYGILKGLKDLHDEGIIHRDIKPENILFDDQDVPKLADFGISASVKKRHTVANFMGHAKEVFATGTYSPPEQIDPKRAMKVMGPANDIYAFGAMMYEVITGGNLPFGPFEEFLENMAAYEQKKENEEWDVNTLQTHAPGNKWVKIISGCLGYLPEDRYQNIDEVLADLGYQATGAGSENYAVTPGCEWKLRVQNGEEIGREYNLTNLMISLENNELTVGWFNEKQPFSNHIGIAEHFTEFISNYHATLQYNPDDFHWYIKDGQWRTRNGIEGWYSSTNGVLVQGKKVSQNGYQLHPDSIISIGDTTLKVIVNRKPN